MAQCSPFFAPALAGFFVLLASCGNDPEGSSANDGGGTGPGGAANSTGGAGPSGGASPTGGASPNTGGSTPSNNTGGATSPSGGRSGGTSATGGTNASAGEGASVGEDAGAGGASGGTNGSDGGEPASGGSTSPGGAGGTPSNDGGVAGDSGEAGGSDGGGGENSGEAWPNIRVVGNKMCDRWGEPFAVRSIESMFGNGTSDAPAFVAGHKALGANTIGPLPNTSVSSIEDVEALLDAAYEEGLVVGLNADHANQGEGFFQDSEMVELLNRYPNVFLQQAVELGNDMSENEWVEAAQDKVDAYVELYPDKPLKLGSPFGGRSPRFPLDRCEEVVDYYYEQGGRGGLIFTAQLYWAASGDSFYQGENGFADDLEGILDAIDAMASSPCLFLPGLDNEDDVGYTGWREVMDHIRESEDDPAQRLGFQWWVYYNSDDPYDNDLTTNPNDALDGITSTGTDVMEKLEQDSELIELGPMNP